MRPIRPLYRLWRLSFERRLRGYRVNTTGYTLSLIAFQPLAPRWSAPELSSRGGWGSRGQVNEVGTVINAEQYGFPVGDKSAGAVALRGLNNQRKTSLQSCCCG
jgi:hypothetical protein